MNTIYKKFKRFMTSDEDATVRRMLVVALCLHVYRWNTNDESLLAHGVVNYLLEIGGAVMGGAIGVALLEVTADIGKFIFKEE